MEEKTRQAVRSEFRQEMANATTHGLGLILSILGLAWLISTAQHTGSLSIFSLTWLNPMAQHSDSFWKVSSVTIFGCSLVLLYLVSTLYHSFQQTHLKRRLRIADHCAIYVLIAGSYTPFALVTLGGAWGWGLFIGVWTLALIGITLKIFFIDRWNVPFTLSYLAMGWLVLIAYQPLVAALQVGGLYLLVAGGLSYSVGSLVYLWEKPFHHHHAIWHVFVLCGSACHFFSVLYFVL